jgi:hypothetical protein
MQDCGWEKRYAGDECSGSCRSYALGDVSSMSVKIDNISPAAEEFSWPYLNWC